MGAIPRVSPAQLALRFGLEIAALVAIGAWARHAAVGSSALGVAAAVALPLAVVAVWGTFAVPNDPSRSGRAPVRVPGWLRLLIELAVFLSGAAALAALGRSWQFVTFATLCLLHHGLTLARIRWLLSQ